MSTEVIVSLLGFLTACVGALRWLGGYWFKQQHALRAAEKTIYAQAVSALGKTLDEKGVEIRNLTHRLKEVESKLNEVLKKAESNQDRLKRVAEDFARFGADTEMRCKESEKIVNELRGQVIDLGNGLKIMKGKPQS